MPKIAIVRSYISYDRYDWVDRETALNLDWTTVTDEEVEYAKAWASAQSAYHIVVQEDLVCGNKLDLQHILDDGKQILAKREADRIKRALAAEKRNEAKAKKAEKEKQQRLEHLKEELARLEQEQAQLMGDDQT